MKLYSSVEVAKILGVTRRRVTALHKSRKVGVKVGGGIVFTMEDIDKMRVREPGRPYPTGQPSKKRRRK